MKAKVLLVVCALVVAAVATATDAGAEARVDMELSTEAEQEQETQVVAEVEADAEVDRKKKKGDATPKNRAGWQRPRIDMSLLRPSANIVYVPKGDPRARPPTQFAHPHSAHHTAQTAAPAVVRQKAPRGGKPKPANPTNPAGGPSTGTGINVGGALAPRPLLRSAAPQYVSAACTAKGGSCTGSCSGSVFHGICPGPAGITCCVPGSAPAPAPSNNCLSSFNAANFAAKATAMQLSYRANGVIYSQSSRQFGSAPAVHYADCSSFVTSVLDAMGWDCLFANGRYTAAMIPIMQSRGGFHSTPQVGDIVMWTSHTGIVTANCGAGKTRMVAMGLHGCADTGCIPLSQLPSWGSGSFLGFWTPH